MSEPPKSFRDLLHRYDHGERSFVEAKLDEDPDNDLSGKCLDGADFSHTFIIAKFRRASLRDARFRQANVKTCDFSEADLRGADFRGAALCSAVFDGARLEGAEFEGASAHSYVFKEGETPIRDATDYRAELEMLQSRFAQERLLGKIVGEGMARFLVVKHDGRAVEIYGSNTRAMIDPAIGDELQGEIEYPGYDMAIAAALRWLRGCEPDELQITDPK
jgi:hypothetical protein